MTARRTLIIAAAVAVLALLAWAVSAGLERLAGVEPAAAPRAAEPVSPPPGVPRITATVFYGSADGQALAAVRREVALAEGVVPQGREILMAQLQGAPEPHVSVIPAGTLLRAFYVTGQGDAFVDLSSEITTQHPGGSSTELLTVYAVVNAVLANLPTIRRVQILVEGREVDTLAGHVDIRRPLERDVSLVREMPEAISNLQ